VPDENKLSGIEELGLRLKLKEMGKRHIEGPHVSKSEWIRKCQYQELRWARMQINPTTK
jgi:hypothetical protein